MFFFLFFLVNSFCSHITRSLSPGEKVTYFEIITEEDQFANLSIGLVSKGEDVFYRIVPPGKDSKKRGFNKKMSLYDSDSMHDESTKEDSTDLSNYEYPLEKSVLTKLDIQGSYLIQIYNKGDEEVKYTISSNLIKKMAKPNEDVISLRDTLATLQSSIINLGTENQYSKSIQEKNIQDLARISRQLGLLILYPVGIVLGGFLSNYLARQLVRPVGKRFRGLF